jgi:hypothetical protein
MKHSAPDDPRGRSATRRLVLLVVASTVATSLLVGLAAARALPHVATHTVFARSAGVTAYVLLVLLVLTGLVLAHPWATRLRRPSPSTRIRLHVTLAATTLAFTLVHALMWATNTAGGVGWWGAFVPWGSAYRPLHVSLGVLGLYAGVLAGVTASMAGRRAAARLWWPVHKVAVVALALVWVHALGGVDAHALLPFYVGTGLLVVVVGVSRQLALRHRDHAQAMGDAEARELVRTGPRTWRP